MVTVLNANMMVHELVDFENDGCKFDIVYSLFDKEYVDAIISLLIISSSQEGTLY